MMRRLRAVVVVFAWGNASVELFSRIDWHLLWSEYLAAHNYQLYTFLGAVGCAAIAVDAIHRGFFPDGEAP